ncbi:hypothetical protein CFC21_039169 [Triticum aestivum]|uniref:Jacalin-type lectin domain-containing protein n=2 Tax=Triticum aestivum TaxID=4565 RepID=A0A3B6FFU4_WHEAT|nr:hypothetical protein CFC21_039169 [Triticum aestivum]
MPPSAHTSSVPECAAGHQVCSTCHGNLADKNKCTSCFITAGFSRCFIRTSYSRCHDVERMLSSVHIACRSTVYQEKVEHEKTCPVRAGMQAMVSVVKTGPCGGGDGKEWDMDVRGVNCITKVVVWHRSCVFDAMSVLYERDGRVEQTEEWGKPAASAGGERSEICLELDEYLISVKGHLGTIYDRLSVRSLTFISNRRTYGPYGKEEGAPFELPAAGGRIVGFHGRSDSYLNALGTYVKMDA